MLPNIKKYNILTGSDEEAANELSSFFTSVFVKEGDIIIISKPANSMLDCSISVDDVCKKLKQLKDDKSPGFDGIHPMVLKNMAEIVALPLKLIFNRSMLSNKLHLEWKRFSKCLSLRCNI